MAIETIYRQKAPHNLTEAQRTVKIQKDSEYEIAVQNLSTSFYQKKRSVGVTAEEEATYKQTKSQLWNDYRIWAISENLYEEVTPEQQLTEAETALTAQLEHVNLIRNESGRPLLEIQEVIKVI